MDIILSDFDSSVKKLLKSLIDDGYFLFSKDDFYCNLLNCENVTTESARRLIVDLNAILGFIEINHNKDTIKITKKAVRFLSKID